MLNLDELTTLNYEKEVYLTQDFIKKVKIFMHALEEYNFFKENILYKGQAIKFSDGKEMIIFKIDH